MTPETYSGLRDMANESSKVEGFPVVCPLCGKPKADYWVKGWHGWTCGSYAMTHDASSGLNVQQSIECAVSHWKQRALRAEWLLTLVPVPDHIVQ